MTETAPEDDRRKASTEPGLDGEGDQYAAASGHTEDADRTPEEARETQVDEDRES
ncbi:hypothetical protein [Arthrobacter sp. HMWF013]|uniref:hypothetical protein n=1 Tax=Arthrobacter sp. HMWF013 TaxID=2056849 RepID=UPI0015E800DF|nr:hypothetical protein [Arthrobacter sp. HMWF013]